jgi:hypothetical protein
MASPGVDWGPDSLDDPKTRRRRNDFRNDAIRNLKPAKRAILILLTLGCGLLLIACFPIIAYTGFD